MEGMLAEEGRAHDGFEALVNLDPGALVEARGGLWELMAAPNQTRDGGFAVLRLRAIGETARGDVAEHLEVLIGRDSPIEPVTVVTLRGVFDEPRLSAYPDWWSLLMAMRLSAVGAGDRPTSLQDARIQIEWYQYEPVVKALAQRVPRLLVADDVGLGKTIEAGLILLELRARKRADRVLIVVPSNLQYQWRDELWEKFGLRFAVFDREGIAKTEAQLEVGQSPWKEAPCIITSVDLVKDRAHRRALLDDPDLRWDVLIIDEAHHVAPTGTGNGQLRSTLRSELAQGLADRTDALLLLTATPHDGYRASFTSLLTLLDPSLLPDPDRITDRDRDLIDRHFVRRLKAWLFDEQQQRIFRPRHVETMSVTMAGEEKKTHDAIARHIERKRREAERVADGGDDPDQRRRARVAAFAMEILKKRLGSSWAAIAHSLAQRRKAREDDRQKLADEAAATVDDASLDPEITALVEGEELTEQVTEAAEDRLVSAVRATEAEIEELGRLARRAEAIATSQQDAKLRAIATLLGSVFDGSCEIDGQQLKAERVIVFTEYLATRDHLLAFLRREPWARDGQAIALMQGGMSRKKRNAALKQFAGGRLLLATDAISEGINLQDHAHVVIHAEIPWNPNRLEQRNGRVDRKGQKRDVFVVNLLLAGTYEGRVLARVLSKLEAIRRDVGSSNAVVGKRIERDALGPMVSEQDLRSKLIGGDVEDDAGAEQAGRSIEQLIDERRQAEEAYRRKTGIFATVFGAEEITAYRNRLTSLRPDAVTPDDIEEFVRMRLAARGVKLRQDSTRARVWMPWPENVPGFDWAREALRPQPDDPDDDDNHIRPFTFHREVALAHPEVAFVTSGHPLVQTLVAGDRRRLWTLDGQAIPGRLAQGAVLDADEAGGAIFVFEGHLQDGAGGLLERRVIPVFVAPNGVVSHEPDADARRAFTPRRLEPLPDFAMGRLSTATSWLEMARAEAVRRLEVWAGDLESSKAKVIEESLAAFEEALPRRKQALASAIAGNDSQTALALTPADRQRHARLKKRLAEFELRAAEERGRIQARRTVRVAIGSTGKVRDLACLLLAPAEKRP